jgi:hypothetical protein
MWDIRVEDAEGNSIEWHDIDLITATQVILEDSGSVRHPQLRHWHTLDGGIEFLGQRR